MKVAKPKKPRIPEKSVQHEIVTLLQLNGWHVTVTDVHVGLLDHGARGKRFVSQGEIGQPDVIATRPRLDGPAKGLSEQLHIETKAPDGRLQPHQRAHHDVLRKHGFIVIVPRSWSDLVRQAAEHGVAVERTHK